MRCPKCSHGVDLVYSKQNDDLEKNIYTSSQIYWCEFCKKAYSIYKTKTLDNIEIIYNWK